MCSFVNDMNYNPPSLLEVAGRCIKINNVRYGPQDLPASLRDYLDSAHHCVNPKCQGEDSFTCTFVIQDKMWTPKSYYYCFTLLKLS